MSWPYSRIVLGICMLAFFVTFFARLAISPVVPFITADFEITNARIGLALTGLWLAYGIAQFPSGVLAERFGEKSIILASVGGTAIASFTLAIAPIFGLFVVSIVLLGLLAGLHYTVATALLARIYSDRQIGGAIGIHNLGAPLAGLTAPVIAAWLGSAYGWRPAVMFVGVIAIPIFAFVLFAIEPTPPAKPTANLRSQVEIESILEIVRRPTIVFTLVIAIGTTFILNGLISFLPTFLIEYRQLSATLAGGFFAAYFVIRGGLQIGVGTISDRFGRDVGISLCLLGGGIGLVLLVHGSGMIALMVGITFASLGASYFPAIEPRFLDNLSNQERSMGFGLVRTVYIVIGSTGSFTLGLTADVFGWPLAISALAGIYGIIFLLLLVNGVARIGL